MISKVVGYIRKFIKFKNCKSKIFPSNISFKKSVTDLTNSKHSSIHPIIPNINSYPSFSSISINIPNNIIIDTHKPNIECFTINPNVRLNSDTSISTPNPTFNTPPTRYNSDTRLFQSSRFNSNADVTKPDNLKILTVDDSVVCRKTFRKILEQSGYRVYEAKHGQECIDQVLNNKLNIDIIVMDDDMPVMDGRQTAIILRKQGYTNIIIGVTGEHRIEEHQKYINCGADFIITKPLCAKTLSEVLQRGRRHND